MRPPPVVDPDDDAGTSPAHRRRWWRLWSAGRVALVGLGHLAVFTLVYWLAFALRFDFHIPADYAGLLLVTLPWVLAAKAAVFYAMGRYHGWWTYVTFADLVALLKATAAAVVLVVAIGYFVAPLRVPRSVVLLDGMMTVLALGAVQTMGRIVRDHIGVPGQCSRRGVLLVGTDRPDVLLAHQINSSPRLRYRVQGFLTIHGRQVRGRIGQIPVLGSLRNLCDVAAAHKVGEILVVAGTLSGRRMRRLMENCDRAGLALKIIAPLEDPFAGGRLIPLRDLDIGDLLRRRPVELDDAAIRGLLHGRRVLVTGAGGSIGSEICRQVLRFQPRELILLGRGENRIYAIERELRAAKGSTQLIPSIGNVSDEPRMRQVFEQYRPEVVFHAAAHKHVPLMESNVGEALRNNVLGTRCVADLADEYDVKSFVLISTDKAVNPTSVMGASKHLAERYVHALSQCSAMRFVAVRLGNVLGSAGSVVPLFREQIRRGGPITVTDPRMTRYFMTIPEATQLVLQATSMGKGGEIFVLDMGEPVRIVDLADDLVRLSGLPPHAIDIAYTGIRPGEKLHEDLYFHDEHRLSTTHSKVQVAQHRTCDYNEVVRLLQHLERCAGESDEVLLQVLRQAIPEFRPRGNVRPAGEAVAAGRDNAKPGDARATV